MHLLSLSFDDLLRHHMRLYPHQQALLSSLHHVFIRLHLRVHKQQSQREGLFETLHLAHVVPELGTLSGRQGRLSLVVGKGVAEIDEEALDHDQNNVEGLVEAVLVGLIGGVLAVVQTELKVVSLEEEFALDLGLKKEGLEREA